MGEALEERGEGGGGRFIMADVAATDQMAIRAIAGERPETGNQGVSARRAAKAGNCRGVAAGERNRRGGQGIVGGQRGGHQAVAASNLEVKIALKASFNDYRRDARTASGRRLSPIVSDRLSSM